jgi:putative polyhydroxyalkanoate system protein
VNQSTDGGTLAEAGRAAAGRQRLRVTGAAGMPDNRTMPKIDIRQPHQLPLADARAKVDHVATRMREKFDMDSRWEGDTLRFSRSGVKGSIAVSTSAVEVHAELGLMLSPLKGMVEEEIRRKLAEQFA